MKLLLPLLVLLSITLKADFNVPASGGGGICEVVCQGTNSSVTCYFIPLPPATNYTNFGHISLTKSNTMLIMSMELTNNRVYQLQCSMQLKTNAMWFRAFDIPAQMTVHPFTYMVNIATNVPRMFYRLAYYQ